MVTATPTLALSGQSSVLSVSNPIAGDTYTWAADPTLNTTNGSTVTATPTVNTVYTVTQTDSKGCMATGQVLVSTVGLVCGNTYHDTLGSYGRVDTLDAHGGVVNFHAGNYRVQSTIVRETARLIFPQAVPYIDGYSGRSYNDTIIDAEERNEGLLPDGSTGQKIVKTILGSYIYLLKANLNIQGATLQASCDTMWGGILTCGRKLHQVQNNNNAATYPTMYSSIRLTSGGGHRPILKDAFIGIHSGAATLPAPNKAGTRVPTTAPYLTTVITH